MGLDRVDELVVVQNNDSVVQRSREPGHRELSRTGKPVDPYEGRWDRRHDCKRIRGNT